MYSTRAPWRIREKCHGVVFFVRLDGKYPGCFACSFCSVNGFGLTLVATVPLINC